MEHYGIPQAKLRAPWVDTDSKTKNQNFSPNFLAEINISFATFRENFPDLVQAMV